MAFQGFKLNLFNNKNNQDLVGFDLDDDRIKIPHVRLAGLKREVMNLLSQEVRGLSDDDIVLLIRQTLEKFNLKQARAFLSVPLHLVITRSIEIPSRDPEEIREIMNLQASRHTPYSRSEIIVDMMNLGVVRESYTKILLIIIPKEVVTRQIQIIEKTNLKLEKVFFPPEGICQACSRILNNESSDNVIGIVNMDVGFTSFIAIQKNKILFVRGIPIGASHLLEEREIYYDRFVDELQKSLEAYTADEMGAPPKMLLLTGVVAEVNELDDLFLETFHIPIRHQTYFNHFAISNQARMAASSSKKISFFNLIAPLLLFDKMKIDLTSDDRKLKIQLERRGREMLKTGVLAMMFLCLVFSAFVSKMYFKKAYLTHLQTRYKAVREDAKQLEQVFAKTQVVKDYLANRGNSLETLTELYEATPLDVRLNYIKYDEGAKFSVKGTSSVMSSVFNFVSNLEKSKVFKSVKAKYVTTRSENGADVADFEIDCLLDKGMVAA